MGSGDVGDGDGRAGDDQAFIDMVSAHMQRNPKLKRSDGIDAMRKTPMECAPCSKGAMPV